MKKVGLYLLIFVLMFSGTASYGVTEPSSWAENAIEQLKDRQIIKEELFANYQSNISRQDYAYLVYKLIESYGIRVSQLCDLNKSYTLSDTDDFYVMAMFKADIITGYPDGTFKPEKPITREEICTLYMKTLEKIGVELGLDTSVLDGFQDSDQITGWAKDSIVKCLNQGIINGTPGGYISPLALSSVEQSLVIFERIVSSNMVLSDHENSAYEVEEAGPISTYKGRVYYVTSTISGNVSGLNIYRDFEVERTLSIEGLSREIGVNDQGLYFRSESDLYLYDFDKNSITTVMTGVVDFVVDEYVYYFNEEGLYQLGDKEPLYLTDSQVSGLKASGVKAGFILSFIEDGQLKIIEDETVRTISDGVSSYHIGKDRFVVVSDEGTLKSISKDVYSEEVLDTQVTDVELVGANLLYIKNGQTLYNVNRGIKLELYQGEGLIMTADSNVVVIGESTIGGFSYNHFTALFSLKEYMEYN